MPREDAVMVVIEARAPLFEQLGDLAVAARGAQVAPAVHYVHLGGVASTIVLDDAERPTMRPGGAFQAGERSGDPRMVHMDALLAGAHAKAAAHLVTQARTLALDLKPERLKAEPMLIGGSAQCRHGCRARAPQPVDEGQRLGIDLLAARETQPPAIERKAAELPWAAQLAVVDRVELLDERGLAQQRAELARGALPLDAPHARRPARAGDEMLQNARAHGAALTDVEGRGTVVMEKIDAGRVGNRVDGSRREVRRQRRLARHLASCDVEHVLAVVGGGDAQELPQRRGVGRGAMARFAFQAVALDQAVEIMRALAGIEP